MRHFFAIVLILSLAIFTGCTTTQKATGVGTVAGAGLGGIIGHQSGHGAEGAAIGAVVGALGGALVGANMEKKYCPTCGKGFTSGQEYCPYDGSKLLWKEGKAPRQESAASAEPLTTQAKTEKAPLTKVCPKCQEKYAENFIYCTKDGRELKPLVNP
jgi:RNA polymerase subunit RPABC4/transcription elongation factor Spt4